MGSRERSVKFQSRLLTRAEVVPASLNEEARTVDVIWSTGSRGLRQPFFGDAYYEELEVSEAACDLGRLNNGAPVLNAHNPYELSAVLGVVERAWIADGAGHATLRFSARADVQPIFADIKSRILRHLSVGYDVQRYEEVGKADGHPVLRATKWEPAEVSIVPMGFDDHAVVRAKGATGGVIEIPVTRGAQRQEKNSMGKKFRTIDAAGVVRAEDCPDCEGMSEDDPRYAECCGTDGAGSADEEAARARAAAKARTDAEAAGAARVVAIQRSVRLSGLGEEFASKLVAEGVSLEVARARIDDAMEKRDLEMHGARNGHPRIEVGADPSAAMHRGMENALLHRAAPGAFKLDDNGRRFRGRTLLECAEVLLNARGVKTDGMSKLGRAGAALGLSTRAGAHSTSDFANILADVANKTLRAAYAEAPKTYEPLSRKVTIPDFKNVNRVQLGEAPQLKKVLEGGEFTRGTIGQGKETYALATYGRVFAVNRQVLVNDDMDALSRVPGLFGRAARDIESDLAWEQITSNPTMGDAVALFHATHANLTTGPGTVISVTSLGVARALMRKQVGVASTTRLNVMAKYLIVPAALETLADQLVSTALLASASSSVNPFAGRLQVIAEPRLDDNSLTAWYLGADPGQVDMLEVAYLDGEGDGPMVETRIGFDVDGLEIKARHDFAAKVIDHRGLYKNVGA